MNSYSCLVARSANAFLLVVGVVLTAGCGSSARDLALDKAKAHQSLVEFLDTWKAGKPVSEFMSTHAKAAARDPDWEAGKVLTNYTIGAETDDGTNLHATVKMTLKDPKGEQSDEEIVYIVGTSPVLSIFRQ